MIPPTLRPSAPFVAASWVAFATGTLAFMVGLTNAKMMLNEQGYYLTVLLFGLFSTVTIYKTFRDREEGHPVTPLYLGMCLTAFGAALTLLVVGLINADSLALSEKGFYGMSFVLSLFGAISVQKNVRDLAVLDRMSLPTPSSNGALANRPSAKATGSVDQ